MRSFQLKHLSLLFFITGCASPGTPSPSELRQQAMLINQGMTKSDVITILGPPAQRSFKGAAEALTFCGIAPFAGSEFHTVWLIDGTVNAMTNYSKNSDVGNCGQYVTPIDWGQAPPDIKVRLQLN